jgi:hypothetical protein
MGSLWTVDRRGASLGLVSFDVYFLIAIPWHSRELFICARGNEIWSTDVVVRIMVIEVYFLYSTDWERSVEEAKRRNMHS